MHFATNGASFDFPKYVVDPSVTFVITSTPRSGSNMLTRALWNTGLAGFPEEYLTPKYVDDFLRRPDFSDCEASFGAYVRRLQRVRTSPNGVFGLKAHSSHLNSKILEGRPLTYHLPGARYIFIDRRDRVKQAISYVLAEDSNVWIVDGKHLPLTSKVQKSNYSRGRIDNHIKTLRQDAERLEKFFAQSGIVPHRVEYEDLTQDYQETVASCLAFLGVAPPEVIQGPGISRQSGAVNEEWELRYRNEHS